MLNINIITTEPLSREQRGIIINEFSKVASRVIANKGEGSCITFNGPAGYPQEDSFYFFARDYSDINQESGGNGNAIHQFEVSGKIK